MANPNIFPFPSGSRDEGGGPTQRVIETVFVEQHKRLLSFLTIRLGSPTEAQDAAQATFLRLWQSAGRLRDENLTALLFVTARNIATDILRTRRSALQKSLDAQDDAASERAASLADESPLADRIIEARQALAVIGKILDELPQKCRSAFIAYRFEAMSYPEIAQRMGVTESMIRKYVLRAAAHCAERFEELEGWE
jgi:RNA polymerase sigma-70 factor (ECF subfamily)